MNIQVTVAVITYNQANYIRKALDSVLSQETSFSYEIIVHDDCSTDGTVEILEEYEHRYPGIIQCLYENRNRFSENIQGGYMRALIAPIAKGKYITQIEGDDFWSDPLKLQTQFEYMESHPTCAECAHAAQVIDGRTGELLGTMGGDSTCDLAAERIVQNWCLPTASRFARKDVVLDYAKKWTFPTAANDFPSAIFSALTSYVHYDSRRMSVYRYRSPGSYTDKLTSFDWPHELEVAKKWVAMLEAIDRESEGVLHDALICHASGYVSIIYKQCGNVFSAGSFADEAFKSLGYSSLLKCYLKRFLWVCGFSSIGIGWGNQKRHKLVKVA